MTPITPTTPMPATGATNDTATAIEAGKRLADAKKHPHQDGLPFIILSDGAGNERVETLPLEPRPHRRAGQVHLRDSESFVAYVNRHKANGAPAIYGTIEPARFVAVMNEHGDVPGHRDWRANFDVPTSREWSIWTASNRKQMSQIGFAAFIEDNLPDINDPDGATLLEMTNNFEVTKNSSFRSVQRLHNGTVDFAYADDDIGGGKLTIPQLIELRIPVFESDALYELRARFKYKLTDGKLAIWYELVRPHTVLEEALDCIRYQVKSGTGLAILNGTPE